MYSWGFEVVLFSMHNTQNGVSSIPVITKRAQLTISKIQLGGFDDVMCWDVMKM